MKNKLIIFLVLLFFFTVVVIFKNVKADVCDNDLECKQIKSEITSLTTQLNSQQTDYQKLLTQLNGIKTRLGYLAQEIQKKEQEVKEGEQALVYQKILLNERVKSYYKSVTQESLSLVDIFVAENLSDSLRKFFYQKSLSDQDKQTIVKIVLYIKNLEEIKANLQSEKQQLAILQQEVDKQSKLLADKIAQTQQQIAALSAKQQQIIAQKLASLNISRSAASMGRCDSDLTNGRDPGFSPRIAIFTYGVPNRVGLNQWGAYGRARNDHEGYEQILRAYYNFDEIKDFDENIQIRVNGHSSYKLDDYVKRIYEVPNDWGDNGGMEALKAQAIAARSYVLAYTNNGSGSICDSESCQVFKDGEKGGNWNAAVEATKNKAMVQGSNPIKAWFSSTHGGYVFSSGEIGWSGTSWTKHANDATGGVNNFSDLQNNAYDKESPWFYCDWGSRPGYNKTAWLKPEELADIVNAIMLARNDSSTTEHLYQPDNPPSGTDTWNQDKVKQELRNRGGNPFNSVDNVSVSADFGAGRTTSINVSGDAGSQSFDGGEFKNFFNLRAPANIQIVGPLYNAEKR